jgi:hypothetical protein
MIAPAITGYFQSADEDDADEDSNDNVVIAMNRSGRVLIEPSEIPNDSVVIDGSAILNYVDVSWPALFILTLWLVEQYHHCLHLCNMIVWGGDVLL